ncbi:MAG TPA: carboxypeptidase regulatory-like domain-containing protein, partial [Gemmatimonadaceae bacterium]
MFTRTLMAGAMFFFAAAPLAAQTADSLAYRKRLLGVFDFQSGEPLEGVEITDLLAQVTALTTKTGTVSLAFLPEGGTLVRVRKVGYQPTTLTVVISPADTVPITVTLAASGVALPKVVTLDS